MTDASTNMSPEWIAKVTKDHPWVILPNGNIRSGPVRLSFANLMERSKPIPPNTEGKYSTNLIIPLGADLTVPKAEAARVAKDKWPQAGTPQGPKLKTPFKAQDDMLKYAGYQAGGTFITAISDQKPPVVDQRLAPVVEKEKAASGFWAMVTIRPFAYDKGVNKGVSFGLQSVMIIAEDVVFSGGASNPNADFAGVNIDASVNPAAGFGEGSAASADEVDLFS